MSAEIYAAHQAREVIKNSFGNDARLVDHTEEFIDLYYYFLDKQK